MPIAFRNECYLAFFQFILISKRSISIGTEREKNLESFETAQQNSIELSTDVKLHTSCGYRAVQYIRIFTIVAPQKKQVGLARALCYKNNCYISRLFTQQNEHCDWLIVDHVPLIRLKWIPTRIQLRSCCSRAKYETIV